MTKLICAALCVAITSCSSSSTTSNEAASGVPVEILGTWTALCAENIPQDPNTLFEIDTIFVSDTEFNYEQKTFTDADCTVPIDLDVLQLGSGVFGESITTTGGFEARNFDRKVTSVEYGDGTVMDLDDFPYFGIYVIQDDVLYLDDALTEAERPDTISFDKGFIKQ